MYISLFKFIITNGFYLYLIADFIAIDDNDNKKYKLSYTTHEDSHDQN